MRLILFRDKREKKKVSERKEGKGRERRRTKSLDTHA
jgi:hypothetical protein